MNDTPVIAHVKRWLDQFIIDLNLCPFANRERNRDTIRFVVSAAEHQYRLLEDLAGEFEYLNTHPDTETTLLIHPNVLTDFTDYNQFLNDVDDLLEALGLTGTYQVASFHPDYRFANTRADDPENYTNRSPYPLLHVLREASVERAINQHPDVDGIPATNVKKLNDLGTEEIDALRKTIDTIN